MFKKAVKLIVIIALLMPAAVFRVAYGGETKTNGSQGNGTEQVSVAAGNEQPQEKERKIRYWVAPMDPNYIRNEPGKSPMGMDRSFSRCIPLTWWQHSRSICRH